LANDNGFYHSLLYVSFRRAARLAKASGFFKFVERRLRDGLRQMRNQNKFTVIPDESQLLDGG